MFIRKYSNDGNGKRRFRVKSLGACLCLLENSSDSMVSFRKAISFGTELAFHPACQVSSFDSFFPPFFEKEYKKFHLG
jgi:hypothetical protein